MRRALTWRVEALHSSAMENFLARSRRSARLRAHLRKAEIDTARLEKRQHSKQGAGYTSRGVTSVAVAAIVAEHPAVAAAWYVKNLTVNTRVFKFMRVRVLRI